MTARFVVQFDCSGGRGNSQARVVIFTAKQDLHEIRGANGGAQRARRYRGGYVRNMMHTRGRVVASIAVILSVLFGFSFASAAMRGARYGSPLPTPAVPAHP